MPMYHYACSCGHQETAFRHIEQRHQGPECHGRMELRIMPTAIHADLPAYQSPIDGRWIEGRAARQEDLKRNNCRPWEGLKDERAHADAVKQDADRKFEQSIEAGTHAVLNGMSAEKQHLLKSQM